MAMNGLTDDEWRELFEPLAGAVLLRRLFPLLGGSPGAGPFSSGTNPSSISDPEFASRELRVIWRTGAMS